MTEMRREPQVPEARVPVKECFDCPARITSKELAPIHFVKMASSRMLVLQVGEWVQIWGKCSYAHRQVDEQPSRRSEKNGDKSAVAMLKKNERHQRTGRLVLDAYSSNTRQLGCVFQNMEPPKCSSILRKSSSIRKPIQRVKFTKAVVRHADIRDQNPSLGMICPGDPDQRSPPMLQNLRIGLRKRQSGKSDVPVKQRGGWPKIYKN